MIKKIARSSIALLLSLFVIVQSLAYEIPEYDLKAAYLINFAGYIEWPEPPESITICIYGENPFKIATLNALLEAKSNQINASFKYPRQLEQLTDCKILYLALSEHLNLTRIFERLHQAPVLVVTDNQEGLQSGVMINLLVESNRLTFEVNLENILASKLKVSSKLLKLAKTVQ